MSSVAKGDEGEGRSIAPTYEQRGPRKSTTRVPQNKRYLARQRITGGILGKKKNEHMLCDVTQTGGGVQVNCLYKQFPRCAPRIPRCPRPVPRGSVDAFT